MLEHEFLAASANIKVMDPTAEGLQIVRETQSDIYLDCVMSSSFGFGGTNASLVFARAK